jgi:hypothetical protein
MKTADRLRILICTPSILCTCRSPTLCTTILFLITGRGFLVKLTGINHPHFMELENPLPWSQETIGGPYHESDLSPTPPSNSNLLTITFIITLSSTPGSSCHSFSCVFSNQILYAFLFSHTRSSYSAHLIFIALITLVNVETLICIIKVILYTHGQHFRSDNLFYGSRDSVVGIATRYGLEGPGIESRWGEIFRTYPDWLRGPPSLLYNGYWDFPGGKGGRGVMLSTHHLLVPRLRKS